MQRDTHKTRTFVSGRYPTIGYVDTMRAKNEGMDNAVISRLENRTPTTFRR